MGTNAITVGDRTYELDDLGCLKNFYDWQPEFAEALAADVGISPPLSETHKRLLGYLREAVVASGRTPIVHRLCRDNGLKLFELERLFPAGYHRGACRLAGLNYFDRHVTTAPKRERTYRIDGRGFLVDPGEWDEAFAELRAEELGVALTERHWRVLRFIREHAAADGRLPTVFETCHGCALDGDDLARLFPAGYQRGAVKIAGLTLARDAHAAVTDRV